MAADPSDDVPNRPADALAPSSNLTTDEQAMREAEALALATSSLGSGLLARQPPMATSASVAVLKICPQCGTEYETAARFCPADGTALRPKGSDSVVGRVLADRYHILKLIGEGGMGRVYLGEHVKMNRQCAIKVMSPALVNDAESAARFAREASNAARIIHPNVAAVFDYGESDSLIYLVMEYVDGEPLSRLLAREAPFTIERAVDIARQIADGLGAAHELGIVHRDLKPDNILVMRTKAGREVVKVVDFGIAKAIQDTAGDALTRTGLVIGTPEFMSPEQLLGDPIDARSDLYALGCILHLMLTALPPFDAPTREQMIKRRLSEDAPHLQTVDPGLPDAIDRIEARLLARAPGDRYGSATEVRDALAGTHVRRAGLGPTPSLHTPRSMPTVSIEAMARTSTKVTRVAKRPPRRRTPFVLGGFAVIAIGAALAIRGREDSLAVERRNSFYRDSVMKASLSATLPRDTVAPVTNTILMVDSARMREKLLKKQMQDSIAHEAGSAGGAIQEYARAIASRDPAQLRLAYPGVTSDQLASWQRNFDKTERIEAKVQRSSVNLTGSGSAQAEFTLTVVYDYKDSKQSASVKLQQHADLAKRDNGWRIVNLR